MRRFYAISLSFFLLAGLFLGCTKQAPKNEDDNKLTQPVVKIDPPKPGEPKKDNDGGPNKQDDEKQQKYENALDVAVRAVAERKWTDALTAFELARKFNDTEFVQSEIAKVKQRVEQEGAGKTTLKNIQTVLNDGKAEEAIKLIQIALREYGDGDDAAQLVKLRLQAEALQAVQKNEDKDVRFTRFVREGDLALKEDPKNLRAAALAFEQALQASPDADLQKRYDGIRDSLDKYDALRKKAADLRRAGGSLADALAALKDAAAIWPTLQIRADIDECDLALQKRRDTVTVANFDLRNDVGMAGAGNAIADEVLPYLKSKYDLVERDQLKKAIRELKIQQGDNDERKIQQQVGKLANVRYLVVGSISRLARVTVRARLIDVETGLVVQTAKVVAPTMEEAIALAPDLAKQLMMSDDENLQAKPPAADPVPVVKDDAVVPPAPMPPAADAPPPVPIPLENVAPPIVNMKQDAFKVLAAPPANFVAPENPEPLAMQQRNRLLYATIEMGDFLFRAGRYAEAQRQYQFALVLAPDNLLVQQRLANVQPIAPPYLPWRKPRLVVLPFMTQGNVFVVPPSLSYWTPANLAPYFSSRYDVVDPGVVYWYMARMGLSMQDVMADPNARRWLGRAVGVRYMVLGSCVETSGFDVNTYLLDTEFGYLQGQAAINVRNPYELKLRLPELAELTMMTYADRQAYLASDNQKRFERAVFAGRKHMDARRYREARREFSRALEIYPDNVQVQVWYNICQNQVVFEDFVQSRRKDYQGRQAGLAAQRQRQLQLSQAGERARGQAVAEAAGRTEGDRKDRLQYRIDARDAMIRQAQLALKTDRVGISFSLFQGAMDIVPASPLAAGVDQDFALARMRSERAEQLREAQVTAAREETLRKAQKQQLTAALTQLETEQGRSKAKLDAVRAAQAKRDDQAFNAGIEQGRQYKTAKKYEAALAAFQGAQRVANTAKQKERVNNYIDGIVQEQADALAKTPAQKDALKAERERRKNAEALAKQNDAAYQTALQAAQDALAAKNYPVAKAKFEAAKLLYKTDAVLAGLQQIQSDRAAEIAATKQKGADLQTALTQGRAAIAAKDFTGAAKMLAQAKALSPNDPDVQKAQRDLDQAILGAGADADVAAQKVRLQQYQTALATGTAALNAKRYPDAIKALSSAATLMPDSKEARDLLSRAQTESGQAAASDKQRLADFQAAVTAGQKAYLAKNYDAAITSYQQALKLMPKDADAAKGLQQAQDAVNLAAKTGAAFTKAMDAGQKALTGKNYPAAVKAFTDATQLNPNDADARAQLAQARQAVADAAVVANYQKAMTAGKAALTGKKYDVAIKSFKDALKLVPDDKTAQAQLQAAQQAQTDAANAKTQQFTDAMKRGAAAEKKKDYGEAAKAYSDALKVHPKDADALAGWKQNQFALNMQNCQQYLDNAMWMAAQNEADAALRIFPNDQNAQKLRKKAMSKTK